MAKLRGFFSQIGPVGSLDAVFFLGSSYGAGGGVFLAALLLVSFGMAPWTTQLTWQLPNLAGLAPRASTTRGNFASLQFGTKTRGAAKRYAPTFANPRNPLDEVTMYHVPSPRGAAEEESPAAASRAVC